MFKKRSQELELMDDLNLSNEALRKNLDELEIINKWLGGNQVVTNGLHKVLKKYYYKNLPDTTLTIADIGCGGGDILREVAVWAKRKSIPVNLTGVDANSFMVSYATQKCKEYANVQVEQQNIYAEEFKQQQFDVIICSLFCHHFTDEQLVKLLRQLHKQAKLAVIINDLHRHPFAYYSIKWLTQAFSGSYLVKNDAPLSVLRAFRRPELIKILAQAGIQFYSLQWQWAFRWQIILYKR
ncbi:methyltransferase domain-containing protein [Adhaeribacter aquaticus]|uniref:methyltransferase domain-containing protein n=1 Tax=Adhaeribacter aquaticus TaxID=299567 RepID=UPI00047ECDA8|nr:methyltransferase domain-containing protein [Adhaeribacter aquaticus]